MIGPNIKEKKLLLSTTKEEFLERMKFHNEDEENRCQIYLDLKGVSYHVVLANYVGLNKNGMIEYKKVQNMYIYDKRIRNVLYKFLAALEERFRGYISNKYISQKMAYTKRFSRKIHVFHGRQAPEEGLLVGSGAVIDALKLPLPLPNKLAIISEKHRQYQKPGWLVFTPRHKPKDNLYGHLVFSLKYEGINLLLLKKLFEKTDEKVIENIVKNEPLGQLEKPMPLTTCSQS